MNVILIMIDSQNSTYLSPYGNDWIKTPNFERLAKRCVTMDSHWTGSLPTMPCRHEVMAGRHEYLWRGWGPLEPYDVTLAQLCGEKKQVSMLMTDCYHYFQEGSGNYHMDFMGWEFYRGHETDNWITDPIDPPRLYRVMLEEKGDKGEAYMRNTANFRDERDFFGPRLFNAAAEWLDRNHTHDNFFFMIDSFDVHEPFHVPSPYDTMYDPDFVGEWSIWNKYGPVDTYPPEIVKHIRAQYAGKVTMLDRWLGLVLDRMDRYRLWDNTLLIVTSDHGHHLGEHGWIGKNKPPLYRHMINIPLFLSMPDMARPGGSRGPWVTSQIDLYPTVAEALGLDVPDGYVTHGCSLLPLLRGETDKVRDYAHTAYFGFPVTITDGRWVLHKHPARSDNSPLYSYGINLEAFHKRSKDPYVKGEPGQFLPYTDATVFRVPVKERGSFEPEREERTDDLLFDLEVGEDDSQNQLGSHAAEAERLEKMLVAELQRIQAPDEQYERLGLETS